MSDFQHKTVLVTGAAQRIGRAIALALAAAGWNVAVHYRSSRDKAHDLVGEIQAMGRRAVALPADLSQEDEVLTLVPRAVEALGPLGALINNASLFEYDTALTATRAGWDAHMETNLRAPFVLIQSFAAQLPDVETGAVINILDQRVLNLTASFTTYTLSKAALWVLTQTLAQAMAPQIRVNAIGPGPTLPSSRQSAQQFERQCRAMPLRRGARPEEIAEAVLFILAAGAMTGQFIALDGGQHLCRPSAEISPEE